MEEIKAGFPKHAGKGFLKDKHCQSPSLAPLELLSLKASALIPKPGFALS